MPGKTEYKPGRDLQEHVEARLTKYNLVVKNLCLKLGWNQLLEAEELQICLEASITQY